jgi:hypothetical protein
MAHDELGLGVAGRLLMQVFDGGHALALLRGLDAIGEAYQPRANLKWSEQNEAKACPASREDIEVQGRTVKQVQKSMVGLATEVQDAHEAGDPGVVGSTAQAHQYEKHPQEGARAATGGPQNHYCMQPLVP